MSIYLYFIIFLHSLRFINLKKIINENKNINTNEKKTKAISKKQLMESLKSIKQEEKNNNYIETNLICSELINSQ